MTSELEKLVKEKGKVIDGIFFEEDTKGFPAKKELKVLLIEDIKRFFVGLEAKHKKELKDAKSYWQPKLDKERKEKADLLSLIENKIKELKKPHSSRSYPNYIIEFLLDLKEKLK
jgi:hypothetical protein